MKSVLNELKANYKKAVKEIVKQHLKDGFTVEEVKNQLITGTHIGIVGLNQKIESLNNARLSNLDKQVLNDEIEVLKSIINEICDTKTIESTEKNYNKICNFIIGKFGEKAQYFFLDELMKELKQIFKVTQKEFKEIILNMLIDQNKINLRRIELSGHKYLRFYKNGIYYSVDRFIIPEGVYKNTFKA
jgi:hypothetical protein